MLSPKVHFYQSVIYHEKSEYRLHFHLIMQSSQVSPVSRRLMTDPTTREKRRDSVFILVKSVNCL